MAAIRKKASNVFLLNRASERADKSLESLLDHKEKSKSNTELITIDCDLLSFDSVRSAGENLNEKVLEIGGLHVLINNAGIAYFPDNRTEEGFDVQMQVNHLSHFLLTSIIYDSLKLGAETLGEARIVLHSSAARFLVSYNAKYLVKSKPKTLGGNGALALMNRYANTKLANCLFAVEFNKRIPKGDNIFAVIAEPGLSTTGIINKLDDEAKQDSKLFEVLVSGFRWFARNLTPMQSAADGAMPLATAAYCDSKANDFWVPGGFMQIFGVPKKAIDNGKPTWSFYKESNIFDEKAALDLWKLSEKATGVTFLSKI